MQYLKMATLAKSGVRIQCYWLSYLEPTLGPRTLLIKGGCPTLLCILTHSLYTTWLVVYARAHIQRARWYISYALRYIEESDIRLKIASIGKISIFSYLGLFINYVDRILKIFDPSSPLRRQVYYISLCISIDIWSTPLPPCLST